MTYILLDESGDLGFSKNRNSSRFFIITFLAIEELKPIQKIVEKTHKSLRRKVKKLSGGVLHCYKENPQTRKKLLENLSCSSSVIMTICLNKSKVYTNLHHEMHYLYNYVTNILLDRIFTKKLIKNTKPVILIAAKRETNKFLNMNFESYLTSQIKNNHKMNIKIEIRTPGQEKALQAVDFASWSIFRKYQHEDSTYYDLIKNIIIEENPLFP